MTWLLIGLLFLAAFGPILWLLPNEADKRLSRLRTQARRRGLSVELARLPDPRPRAQDRVSSGGVIKQPVIRCAAYRMAITRPLQDLQPWRVVRGDPEAEMRLHGFLDDMPDGWLAVELDRHGACLYWQEESGDCLQHDGQHDSQLDAVIKLLSGLIGTAVNSQPDQSLEPANLSGKRTART